MIMNEQDKQLLLKVLCEMLPHGIHLYVEHDWFEDEVPPYTCKVTAESHDIITNFANNPITCSLSIKPYLRPMSSMTKEEMLCLQNIIKEKNAYLYENIEKCGYKGTPDYLMYEIAYNFNSKEIDFLNSRHLDYRGLIPMGLALPAPEGMYK